jgi:ATP-dependent DNA ligase
MFDIPIVDDAIINKSQRWKGIMKCYPFSEDRLLKWSPPYIVQPKLDGDRCINKPLAAGSVLMTSEENQFFSVPHITEQLMDSDLWSIPLDGELYSHPLYLEGGHELIHAIASRTVNLHPRHKELEFWVFDMKSAYEQHKRLEFLRNLSFPASIRFTPYIICNNLNEIKNAYDQIIKRGFEGIVVRHMYNMYAESKRSTFLMKFKPKRKDVYKIVGWNEEISKEGIPKGRIGSIIFSSQEGDEFAVSAGLNDEDREALWKQRHWLAGRHGIVHYQHLTNKHIPKGCFDIEIMPE